MNARQLVARLLEMESPYDIDDPLEKPDPDELAKNARELAKKEEEEIESYAKQLVNTSLERDKLEMAASIYRDRVMRKTNPSGTFDKAGRWWPDGVEKQPCCQQIRQPSRSFPYSLMLHCRTVEHVARLFNVDPIKLRRLVR